MSSGNSTSNHVVNVVPYVDFKWLVERVDQLHDQVSTLKEENQSLRQMIQSIDDKAHGKTKQPEDQSQSSEQLKQCLPSLNHQPSGNLDNTMPAKIWLREILRRSKNGCLDLARFITGARAADTDEIPFFVHERKRGNTKFTYEYSVLVSDFSTSHLGAIYRMLREWRCPRLLPVATRDRQAFEGAFLEMRMTQRPPFRIGGQFSTREPRYVVEIGEMILRSLNHADSTRERRTTYCHVVMDVLSEKRALWLVYRYNGVEEGEWVSKKRKFDRDADMFSFSNFFPNFDLAKIAEDMADWVHEDGSFVTVHNFEHLIKTTHARANPNFTRPVYEEYVAQEGRQRDVNQQHTKHDG